MSIELVRGGGRFKRDPTEGAESAGGRGLLQMIRTKQEWDLLAKAASVNVNNQQQQYFSLPPLPLLPNLRPPCGSISSSPPRHFRQKCF